MQQMDFRHDRPEQYVQILAPVPAWCCERTEAPGKLHSATEQSLTRISHVYS